MSLCVWRASGSAFDVDSFLRRFPNIIPDLVWHKGETHRRGRVWPDSGFNMTLFDTPSSETASEDIEREIEPWRSVAEAMLQAEAESTLDIALIVGSDTTFTDSVCITPKVMQLLAILKIKLTVSAYPSDD